MCQKLFTFTSNGLMAQAEAILYARSALEAESCAKSHARCQDVLRLKLHERIWAQELLSFGLMNT